MFNLKRKISTKLKKLHEKHARTKDTKNIENGGSYLMNSELQRKRRLSFFVYIMKMSVLRLLKQVQYKLKSTNIKIDFAWIKELREDL